MANKGTGMKRFLGGVLGVAFFGVNGSEFRDWQLEEERLATWVAIGSDGTRSQDVTVHIGDKDDSANQLKITRELRRAVECRGESPVLSLDGDGASSALLLSKQPTGNESQTTAVVPQKSPPTLCVVACCVELWHSLRNKARKARTQLGSKKNGKVV